jgi:cell division protein FtsQ
MIAVYCVNHLKAAPHFPIKTVKVVGARHIDHQAVQYSVGPMVDRGFFGVEVEAIKDKLMQISWVSDVSVRRLWPDQVLVTITEKNPIAHWNNTSVLSSAGDLFIPNLGSAPGELPQFFGPEGKQIFVMEYYNRLNGLLTPLHFKVARLELTPTHLWNVTLDNGMKLTVAHKDFLTRFSHFVKVYPKIVGGRASDIDYVDLRYPNGLAVRWKSVTQNV